MNSELARQGNSSLSLANANSVKLEHTHSSNKLNLGTAINVLSKQYVKEEIIWDQLQDIGEQVIHRAL